MKEEDSAVLCDDVMRGVHKNSERRKQFCRGRVGQTEDWCRSVSLPPLRLLISKVF